MVRLVKMVGVDRYRRETKDWTWVKVAVKNKHYMSKKARHLSTYIGRPSIWGNPFPLRKESLRDQVCDQYEVHMAQCLLNGTITDADFKALDGKYLMCFCKPKRCHGDTIAMLFWLEDHEKRLEWAREKLSSVHS